MWKKTLRPWDCKICGSHEANDEDKLCEACWNFIKKGIIKIDMRIKA